MMAEAAQRYGIIVRDKTLHAIGFYAEDPSPLGTNPYTRLFDGKSPSELLAELPLEPPPGRQVDPQIQYRLTWSIATRHFRVTSATAARSLAVPDHD